MLTAGDIKNLTEYQKQVFVTKVEFGFAFKEIKASFSALQGSVDTIIKNKSANNARAIAAN